MALFEKQFLEKGKVQTFVLTDRCSWSVPGAVKGDHGDNEGRVETIEREGSVYTKCIFGPCVRELIDYEQVMNVVWGTEWKSLILEKRGCSFLAERYTLLDGQRLVLIGLDGEDWLLLHDSHASFEDENWRTWFPESVWK